MIARAIIPIILLILLADVYIDRHYLRRSRWWKRLLWWLPAVGMVAFAVRLGLEPNFLPDDLAVLNTFLFLFGLLVVPKLLFSLFTFLGHLYCRLFRKHRNYGALLGLLSVFVTWFILFYGTFVGFSQFEVRRVEVAVSDLPPAFDGYRVVQFSDAHVGTLMGSRRHILQRAVDSINAQRPDAIVFTGDLQNQSPAELYPHRDLLSTLQTRDGVYSVLGNHDYAEYVACDPSTKVANCRETCSLERQLGWTLLKNEHRVIERDGQHIVMAGMENDGEGRFPQLGDLQKTLDGVGERDFVLMLEHDPTSWRRRILPGSQAQLTLSGHTHAMQFELFGWSPVAFSYREYDGLYEEDGRFLFVSKGLGGVIPFRFGAPGEIVVITLRSKK